MTTKWNLASSAYGIGVDSTGLIASCQGASVIVCHDFGAGLDYLYNPYTGLWNGSGTANPITGVGGVSPTSGPIAGPVIPSFGGNALGSDLLSVTINGGTNGFVNQSVGAALVAGGWSTWDDAAGSQTTWATAGLSANVTLSNGNQTARISGSGNTSVLASNGLSSGKVFFEALVNEATSANGGVSLANSSLANNAIAGAGAVGWSWWFGGFMFGLGGTPGGYLSSDSGTHIVLANTAPAPSYFEVTISKISTGSAEIGIANGSQNLRYFLGQGTNGISFNPTNLGAASIVYNSTIVATWTASEAATFGIAFNNSNQFWVLDTESGLWLNQAITSQNPAIGLGGILAPGVFSGGSVFPAISPFPVASETSDGLVSVSVSLNTTGPWVGYDPFPVAGQGFFPHGLGLNFPSKTLAAAFGTLALGNALQKNQARTRRQLLRLPGGRP